MTKEEIQKLAEKIVQGTATEEEILQYNRICDFAEAKGSESIQITAVQKKKVNGALKKALFEEEGMGRVRNMWWVRRTAAAAIILLVLGGVFFMLQKRTTHEPPIAKLPVLHTDSTRMLVHHEVNTTGTEKRIQLPDGSLIVLADKSEITYTEPFINKRDISLTGKAYFKVAKDKTRPFTVFSSEISTTALGTEFTVTAFKNANQILVRLYEGKVVVKAVDEANKNMKKDVYLLPGEEFVYSHQATAKKGFAKKNASPEQIMNDEQANDQPSLPQNTKGTWFQFNNRPLNEVFDELAELYNVDIKYDKKDLKNLYFIGKYNSSDSVETILKRIAILNNLTITRSEHSFSIRK